MVTSREIVAENRFESVCKIVEPFLIINAYETDIN